MKQNSEAGNLKWSQIHASDMFIVHKMQINMYYNMLQ